MRVFNRALIILSFLLTASRSPAQAPAAQPGPEQKRLQYFVGNWTSTLEMKQSVLGPAGQVTGMDHNEMLPGGFFLLRRTESHAPRGDIKALEVFRYDPAAKLYVQQGFNSLGGAGMYMGTVEGKTWTFNSDTSVNGKSWKSRVTLKELSPTSYTYALDLNDGKNWMNVLAGKLTKVK